MKANEMPEKLYISPTSFEVGEAFTSILTSKSKGDIEYVRTDAFIEKAITWLKENITNDYTASKVISRKGCVTMGMLIEDFKQAMKL